MIVKYAATLSATVLLLTLAASSFQFVTRYVVMAGTAGGETLHFEFTIDASRGRSYEIEPELKHFLEDRINFFTDGPAQVISAELEVTPKIVSRSQGRAHFSSPGAALNARVRWDTPGNSTNGSHSYIYLFFPEIPSLKGNSISLYSSELENGEERRYLMREVITYRTPLRLSLGRFTFAMVAGLPIGIALHTIFWAFLLKGEKRSRLAALPPNGSGWPRWFYPDPIAEWSIWLFVLGIGALVLSMVTGSCVYEGFISSSRMHFVYGVFAVDAALALVCVYFTRQSLLTVRVDAGSMSYAYGRGDLRWGNASRSDILAFTQRFTRSKGHTTHWIEIEFRDNRRTLKIRDSIGGYAELREILKDLFDS